MGKKASDEICRGNYDRLRAIFDAAIPDHQRFEMAYAFGVDVGTYTVLVVKTTTYRYTSYAVGFDATANDIVVLPVAQDMSGHGQPIYLKNSDIRSAKQSFINKEFTIKDDRLPKKYIQFVMSERLDDDPDNICILIEQTEHVQRFTQFFKNSFRR